MTRELVLDSLIDDGTGSVVAMNLETGGIEASFPVTSLSARQRHRRTPGRVIVNGLFDLGLEVFTGDGELLSTAPTITGPMSLARDQVVAVRQGQIAYYDVK